MWFIGRITVVRFLVFLLMVVFTGCVQTLGPNPLPVDPDQVEAPRTPSEITQRVVNDLRAKVQPADKVKLRKYAAMYATAADALEQSSRPAPQIMQAVRQMPTEFVVDRLDYVATELTLVMPPTADPQSNRTEIARAFRAVSDACLILSK
jgi:hypothetical protein